MPSYEASGAENLRANASVYAGEANASPSGSGKDAGGDATNAKTLSGGQNSTPNGSASTPKGVQSFDADAT